MPPDSLNNPLAAIDVLAAGANTLVQGPPEKIDEFIAALAAVCPGAIVKVDTVPERALDGVSVIIVENVARYTPSEQLELFTWLNEKGPGIQLVSTANQRLFDLVQSGQFLEALYYRLNALLVDFGSPLALVFATLFGARG